MGELTSINDRLTLGHLAREFAEARAESCRCEGVNAGQGNARTRRAILLQRGDEARNAINHPGKVAQAGIGEAFVDDMIDKMDEL